MNEKNDILESEFLEFLKRKKSTGAFFEMKPPPDHNPFPESGERVEADSEGEGTLKDFMLEALNRTKASMMANLNTQKMFPKKRRAFDFQLWLENAEANFRCGFQVIVEPDDLIQHAEIFMNDLPRKEIKTSELSEQLELSIDELIGDISNELEKVSIQQKETGEDVHIQIAGSRRIFHLQDRKYFVQSVSVVYPFSMPRVQSIVNYFFRQKPPVDPTNN